MVHYVQQERRHNFSIEGGQLKKKICKKRLIRDGWGIKSNLRMCLNVHSSSLEISFTKQTHLWRCLRF